ncbi:MAG: ARPP-1 family domain-containing protein [Desulfosoma sp.]|uniref:ARPP-1 family domain-containing protein n=1 Tax=Desulfosoma sp. TaxID=2603217 RepID=UPI00404A54B4
MNERVTTQKIVPEDLVLGMTRTHKALGMVCLVRENPVPSLSNVWLLEEALRNGAVHITEMDSFGQVPFLQLVNDGDRPVLILDGEELVGGKQNRIVNTTVLVPAAQKIIIPVSCMEAGRWRANRSDFEAGQAVFRARSRAKHKESVTQNLRFQMQFLSDQHAVWREVDRSLDELGAVSETRDFRSARQCLEDRIARYLSNLRPVNAQVGAVFFGPPGVLGCELLGSSDLFFKAFEKILKSFAFEVALLEGEVTAHHHNVAKWWHEVLSTPVEWFDSPGDGQDVRLESPLMIGSGLVWNDQLIHFSCFPKELVHTGHGPSFGTHRLSVSARRRTMRRRQEDT